MVLKITPKQRTKINARYAKLAVIAIREIVCCWMTEKKQSAYSSFLGTVFTATIF